MLSSFEIFERIGFSFEGAMWWHCFAQDRPGGFFVLWVHVDSIVCGAPSDIWDILRLGACLNELWDVWPAWPMSMFCVIHPATEQHSIAQTCQRRQRLIIPLQHLNCVACGKVLFLAITGGLDWGEASNVFMLLQNYLVFGLNLCRERFVGKHSLCVFPGWLWLFKGAQNVLSRQPTRKHRHWPFSVFPCTDGLLSASVPPHLSIWVCACACMYFCLSVCMYVCNACM